MSKLLTTAELLELRKKADDFATDNLAECCKELTMWSNTGILEDGKVRELARMFDYAGYHSLALAQAEVSRKAVEIISKGGR